MLSPDLEENSLSGYSKLIQYRLHRADRGYAEVILSVGPEHLNRLGVVHGGVLATLLDSATGYAVAFASSATKMQPAVTLSLNTHFLGQARGGDRLIAVGRHIGGGKTIAYAAAEVKTDDGRLIARGDAVYRFLDERKTGNGGGP